MLMFYLVFSCPILSVMEKLNFGWMEPTKWISWLPGEFSTSAFGRGRHLKPLGHARDASCARKTKAPKHFQMPPGVWYGL